VDLGQVTSRGSARTGVGVDQRVSAVKVGEVPVFCLRDSCSNVEELGIGRP